MNIQEYLSKMTEIQNCVLVYIESIDSSEGNFAKLIQLFNDYEIKYHQHELKSLLHLLSSISNNHHHCFEFYDKIERILQFFKTEISKFFVNSEIFDIFKGNKRILLYLFEENILKIDKYFVENITSQKFINLKYHQYFSPEIRPYFKKSDEKWVQEIFNELPSNFYENRKIGENENTICKLIREDAIDDFILYIKETKISLESYINPSIYETNSFLLNKDEISLILYAIFCGSIKIARYLKSRYVKLSPLYFLYVIHSNNAEIFHEFDYLNDLKKSISFEEAIKCHHNEIAQYINDFTVYNSFEISCKFLKYYNFKFITNNFSDENLFIYFIKYDYYIFVDLYLKNKNIDINTVKISNKLFKYN